MEDCIFCKIAGGVFSSATMYEDEDFRVIFDIGPASKGHSLILPKAHYQDITKLPEEMIGKAFSLAKKIGEAQMKAFGAKGFNVVQNNGVAAGQTVFHFHIHVIPRYDGDPVIAGWTVGKADPEELAVLTEQMKKALS